jgi:hypothetical protein
MEKKIKGTNKDFKDLRESKHSANTFWNMATLSIRKKT